MDRSIQILGPRPELDEYLPSGEAADLPFDVNATNPLEDLWCLVRRPRTFFRALRFGPREITPGAWGKAAIGALIAIWTAEILTQRAFGPETLFFGWDRVDPRVAQYLEYRFHLAALLPRVGALLAALYQFFLIATPFLKVSVLLSSTGALCLGLNAFFGLEWVNIRFDRLLLRSLYLYWYLLFAIVPGIGPVIGGFAFLVLSVLSVKWIFDLGFWEAATAVYGIEWLVSVVVTLLLFVPATALLFAFAR